jgi:hypothetical protein
MSESKGRGQHSKRGQMTHLDTDVLAEFRAGLIDGRRGAKIAAHLAGCDRCTALDDNLAGVSALLASVPAPPMPDSVAQRLETVLAAEVTKRNNYAERGEVDRPGKSAAPGRPARTRGFRLATWRVLVPAGAAVVLLAGGGYGLSRVVGGPGSPTTVAGAAGGASASAAASSAAKAASHALPPAAGTSNPVPSARSQLRPQNRIVDVLPATLRQQVAAELRLPRASRPMKATSPQVLACIHLLAGGAPPELVESARFEGQPATISVARTGQHETVWVAGPGCSATSRDLLDTITLP